MVRNKRHPHEKAMFSYERYASVTAGDLLADIIDDNMLQQAYDLFQSVNQEDLSTCLHNWRNLLTEFISKTSSQRSAFLRKLEKTLSPNSLLVFRVFAVRACEVAEEVLILRDDYREALAPGSGNRVTIAGAYGFAHEVKNLNLCEWPYETCEMLGADVDYGDFDEDPSN